MTQTIITNMHFTKLAYTCAMRIVASNVKLCSTPFCWYDCCKACTNENKEKWMCRWYFIVKFQMKIKLIALFNFYGLRCERIKNFFFIIIIKALFDLLFPYVFLAKRKERSLFFIHMRNGQCYVFIFHWSTVCLASMHDDVRWALAQTWFMNWILKQNHYPCR